MGNITRTSHLGLMGVAIFLGYLFFSLGDRAAGFDESSKGLARIRVEDRRGFTRIVFPCDRPEESSVESNLDRRRIIVRFAGTATEITPPRLAKGHHLIKRIEILPDSEKEVLARVVLVNGLVDWVSYRYESPPRIVLYLRARSGSNRSRGGPSSLPVSKKTESVKARKPKSTLKAQGKSPSQTGKSLELAKTPRTKKDTKATESVKARKPKSTLKAQGKSPSQTQYKDAFDLILRERSLNLAKTPMAKIDKKIDKKSVEDLWRPSAKDIPEFIRLGSVYPPDFHEMKENERHLYLKALERCRKRDFSGAKEIVSKIVPEDSLSSVAETLAFFKADCDCRRAEKEGAGTKNYMRAIQSYQEAITQFPQSRFVPNAVLMMATSYRRIRFFQEAQFQYQLFLTKYPENPAASEALFWQGECLFQSGKYGEAKKIFGQFVKGFPRSIHGRIATLRVGDCFYKMGDLERARQQYGVVLSESSDFSYYPLDSLFLAGLSFLENRDFQKGREILFRAINLDPDSKKVMGIMNSIARSYLEENRDEEALRVNLLLGESFGRDDSNGMGLVRLADMRLSHPRLKWPTLCVEAYLDPVGVYQDFLDHCQDLNLIDEVIYSQSLALVEKGEVHQAVTKLKRILSRRHQDALRQRSSSLLAYCLNSLIQLNHGRSEHLKVIRLYKDNADFLLNNENKDKGGLLLVAESFQNLGLLEDALTLYRHVKAADSVAQDHVLFQIGRILSLKGDRKAARKALESFQKTFSRSLYLPQVQKLLGDLSFDMRDYRAAIKWYQLTLASGRGGPDMGRIYAHLGQALKTRGQYKEAMEAYQRAIGRMWPFREQTWAKQLLGESLAELAGYYDDQGRMSKAVEYYGRIVRLSPSEDKVNWALYRLAENHRKMGNMEMMRQVFEDLNKRSPDSLWTKLATLAAGGAALEAKAAPYLTQRPPKN